MFVKKFRIGRLGLMILLLFTLYGCTTTNSQTEYEEAMQLYEDGNYAVAARKFKELKNYRDSEAYYNFSAYENGMEKYNKKKYSEASLIFNGLGDYKDSVNYAFYCSALDSIESGKYTQALDYLGKIRGFLDVDNLVNECEYNEELADKYSEYDYPNTYYYSAELDQPTTIGYKELEECLKEYVYHGSWFQYNGNDILNVSVFNCNGKYRILSADVQFYRGSSIEIQYYNPEYSDTTIHTLTWLPIPLTDGVPYSDDGYLYVDDVLYTTGVYEDELYQQTEQYTQYYETNTTEFIFPYSDTTYLSNLDLYGLTVEECRIARNEIYARHGRLFDSSDLQNYFNSLSWYFGYIEPDDFSDSMLSDIEIANRDLIIAYEKDQGYR